MKEEGEGEIKERVENWRGEKEKCESNRMEVRGEKSEEKKMGRGREERTVEKGRGDRRRKGG